MQPEISLPCSQDPLTWPHSWVIVIPSRLPILSFKIHLNIIFPSTAASSKLPLSFLQVYPPNLLPHVGHMPHVDVVTRMLVRITNLGASSHAVYFRSSIRHISHPLLVQSIANTHTHTLVFRQVGISAGSSTLHWQEWIFWPCSEPELSAELCTALPSVLYQPTEPAMFRKGTLQTNPIFPSNVLPVHDVQRCRYERNGLYCGGLRSDVQTLCKIEDGMDWNGWNMCSRHVTIDCLKPTCDDRLPQTGMWR
jgi:hypothetical protein